VISVTSSRIKSINSDAFVKEHGTNLVSQHMVGYQMWRDYAFFFLSIGGLSLPKNLTKILPKRTWVCEITEVKVCLPIYKNVEVRSFLE
jgi:hypothetical protein